MEKEKCPKFHCKVCIYCTCNDCPICTITWRQICFLQAVNIHFNGTAPASSPFPGHICDSSLWTSHPQSDYFSLVHCNLVFWHFPSSKSSLPFSNLQILPVLGPDFRKQLTGNDQHPTIIYLLEVAFVPYDIRHVGALIHVSQPGAAAHRGEQMCCLTAD